MKADGLKKLGIVGKFNVYANIDYLNRLFSQLKTNTHLLTNVNSFVLLFE